MNMHRNKNKLIRKTVYSVICMVLLSGCTQHVDTTEPESLESETSALQTTNTQVPDTTATEEPETSTTEATTTVITTTTATETTTTATETTEITEITETETMEFTKVLFTEAIPEESEEPEDTQPESIRLKWSDLDIPEEITENTVIGLDESLLTNCEIGYSDSIYGLGLMLRKGPSDSFAYVSQNPILYQEEVEVYAKVEANMGSYVGYWDYVCYHGMWGWCNDSCIKYDPDDLIDVTGITMPGRYYNNYESNSIYDEYSGYYYAKEDGASIKTSCHSSSRTLCYFEEGDRIRLLGTTDPESSWKFILYPDENHNLKLGWVNDPDDDLFYTPTEYFALHSEERRRCQVAAKPAIYLYPEEPTDIHVKLSLHGMELSTTYPKYHNGWNVTAYSDGRIVNKEDGRNYDYLFWDAIIYPDMEYDFSRGFCVKGEDTEQFLREKLTWLGLNEREMNEFIVFWLPLMKHEKYNFVTFQTDCYTNSAELSITPEPDSLLRIFMTTQPMDKPIDVKPQKLEQFERKGFVAVEWGGSKITTD